GASVALAACGVTGRKQIRIGLMGAIRNDAALTPLKKALAERGYVEGKSYELVERYVGETGATYDQLADELVQQQVDVVTSTFDFPAAIARLSPIPAVLIGATDPVASGLAQSLERPGGNVTGVLARPVDGLLHIHMDLLLSVM